MPSTYLQPDEYSAYGAPAGTTVAQVQAASALIDVHLKRPEGLVWDEDGTGSPGWMDALTATLTLSSAAAIAPGANVSATLGANAPMLTIGDVLIADREADDGAIAEPLVVAALPGGNQVTFQSVTFEHPGPVTLEKGLTLKQHKFMPAGRPLTTLAYTPVARLLSGQGRYGYGRRGDAAKYQVDEFNLLAALSHFGGPPAWEFFPLTNTGIDPDTGQVWVPAGVMLAYYSEVNLWYVAGYPANGLPANVKFACAQLIAAIQNNPILGNVKSYKAGNTAIQNFVASNLSNDMMDLLKPYRAKLFN
jgi:hypothetical protein